MSNQYKIRNGWIKGMYIYTALGAGLSGLSIIFVPEKVANLYMLPNQDPLMLGIVGSVFLAFGLVSLLGLLSPLKFLPILLLQLCYKSIWFIGVILPLALRGQLPTYTLPFAIIFVSYIIGDIIAIPFPYLFMGKDKYDRREYGAIFKK